MELITIYNNGLKVANYDAYKSDLENKVNSIVVPIITNDSDKKLVKDTQVKLNHLKKDLNDLRIGKVREITSEFEEQLKNLVNIISEKTEQTKEALKIYEESKITTLQGVKLPSVYEFTITIKTTDTSVLNRIKNDFSNEACSIEVKQKELK